MSEAYERARGGRLTFKGGDLATRKSIDKNRKKTKKKSKDEDKNPITEGDLTAEIADPIEEGGQSENFYTIDAAKRMKYDELFPVEAKKFGYDPKSKSRTVEEALDDRVKKKADRYCK